MINNIKEYNLLTKRRIVIKESFLPLGEIPSLMNRASKTTFAIREQRAIMTWSVGPRGGQWRHAAPQAEPDVIRGSLFLDRGRSKSISKSSRRPNRKPSLAKLPIRVTQFEWCNCFNLEIRVLKRKGWRCDTYLIWRRKQKLEWVKGEGRLLEARRTDSVPMYWFRYWTWSPCTRKRSSHSAR